MKGFSRRVNARSPPATIVSFDYTNKEESIRADIWYDKNGTTKGKNRWEKKVSVLRGWARTISNDDFSDRHVIVRMKRDSWALARIHVILAIDRNAHALLCCCVLRRPPIDRYATYSDRSISITLSITRSTRRISFPWSTNKLRFSEKFCLPRKGVNATTHKLFELRDEKIALRKSHLALTRSHYSYIIVIKNKFHARFL